MELNKCYEVLRHNYYYPELQPEGTIVKCVEDKGNGFYIIQLINNCDKKIEEGIWGWLTKDDNRKFKLI